MAKAKVIKKALSKDPALTKKVIKHARKVAALCTHVDLETLTAYGVLAADLIKTLRKVQSEGAALAEMLRGPTDEE